jgi:hypothetical protein
MGGNMSFDEGTIILVALLAGVGLYIHAFHICSLVADIVKKSHYVEGRVHIDALMAYIYLSTSLLRFGIQDMNYRCVE